jgi:hypothetical protein
MDRKEFNPDQHHFDLIERVRAEADLLIGFDYIGNASLAQFAQDRASLFSEVLSVSYLADRYADESMRTAQAAFKKLVFTFTDPEDYADTLQSQMIVKIIDGFLQRAVGGDNTPTLEQLADHLNVMASRAYFVEQTLQVAGALENLSANDRFTVVNAWLEIAAQPEAAEPGQPL